MLTLTYIIIIAVRNAVVKTCLNLSTVYNAVVETCLNLSTV